jgi:hypothetical protein
LKLLLQYDLAAWIVCVAACNSSCKQLVSQSGKATVPYLSVPSQGTISSRRSLRCRFSHLYRAEYVYTGTTLGCYHCTCPGRCASGPLVSRTLGISATVRVIHAESTTVPVLRGDSLLWLFNLCTQHGASDDPDTWRGQVATSDCQNRRNMMTCTTEHQMSTSIRRI